ncbi:hypothetical protein [Pontiella desulfatans]|uniref:hypothetical protein n=1 Tax=Pontiella desulfatans TaxID=2750659 RepID=UPI00109D7994|nr:hypothetical protein [Pontiella desulfatans]
MASIVFFFRSKRAIQGSWHRHLTYPLPLKMFAFFGSSLFLAALLFIFRNTSFIEAMQCTGYILPFFILVLCGTIETLFFEIQYDDKKIVQRSPWTGEKEIPLDDLWEMQHHKFLDHLMLRSTNGTTIRIAKHLNGSEELTELAKIVIQSL